MASMTDDDRRGQRSRSRSRSPAKLAGVGEAEDRYSKVTTISAKELAAGAAAAKTDVDGDVPMVPDFPALTAQEMGTGSKQYRRIRVPPHRLTPLRAEWDTVMAPIVEHLMLQIRYNPKMRCVELKTSEHTSDSGAIQKGADFIQAYMLGFEIQDAVALLRLDDLFIDTFEVKDVKMLSGDHLSRAIGRIAGQDGKTRFAIENATRTRVVLADSRIHILGSYNNISLARNSICDLIMGAPPGKVYNKMRNVSKRLSERF